MITEVPTLIPAKSAAEILQMSRSWLAANRKGSDAVPFIKIGARVFYDLADIRNYITVHKNCRSDVE